MMTPEQIFEELVAAGDIALYKLDECAEKYPDKTFIHYGETGARLSFAQVKQRADALAAGLAELGVTRGDRVSVLTANSLVAVLAMFAAWRAGALYAPVNFNLRGQLLSYQLNDARPAVLITAPAFSEALGEIAEEMPMRHLIVHADRYGDDAADGEELSRRFDGKQVHRFSSLLASTGPAPQVELSPFDPATIIYTSGTTGPAKGVVLGFRWISQYNFVGRTQLNSEDVIYCDLPMYHVAGAYALVARALWHGNTVGLWDRFSASQFWERIAECGATQCIMLDVMVPWLMSAPPRASDRANTLNKVHMQPLPANHHEVAQRFGFDFVTCGFGQTESGSGFTALIDEFGDEHGTPPELYRGLSKAEYRARAARYGRILLDGRQSIPKGFMGRPSPFLEAAILDEDDNRLPPGAVGQLAFRPRFPGLLMQSYFNKPEATLKAWRNLWFHTGDACVRDEEGNYRFVDRMGGYFRVRGENVSSYEVESLLAAHPAVRAVAAVAAPARIGGEDEIAVFVELKEGQGATEEELAAFAANTMPKYMQPSYIRLIDALPVTPTSKVEKYKLRQMLVAELAQREPASVGRSPANGGAHS